MAAIAPARDLHGRRPPGSPQKLMARMRIDLRASARAATYFREFPDFGDAAPFVRTIVPITAGHFVRKFIDTGAFGRLRGRGLLDSGVQVTVSGSPRCSTSLVARRL